MAQGLAKATDGPYKLFGVVESVGKQPMNEEVIYPKKLKLLFIAIGALVFVLLIANLKPRRLVNSAVHGNWIVKEHHEKTTKVYCYFSRKPRVLQL